MQREWAQIQSILGKKLGSGQTKAWIAPLYPRIEDQALVLTADSEFAASHVRACFLHSLSEAVRETFSNTFAVRIECRRDDALLLKTPHAPRQLNAPVLFDASKHDGSAPEPPDLRKDAYENAGQDVAMPMSRPVPTVADDISGSDLEPFSCLLDNLSTPVVHMKTILTSVPTSSPEPTCFNQAVSALQKRDTPSPRPLPQAQLSLPLHVPGGREAGKNAREPIWRFSFEDFVVGPCNALAYESARSMCGDLLHSDVLFLSSAPGLGKTHLMHAVGKALCAVCNKTAPRVQYLTAEEFASRFYLSIKGQDTDRFKSHYRNLDLLLLEDVHFLQGKEKMQEELLATIKALRDGGGKVVFSSSFAPRELKNMNEHLQSRLSAGLLSVIERPDEETRRRILRSKASLHQVLLPDEVEHILAKHIHADVRQIESCLQNLIIKARLLNSKITLQMAWEVISHYAAHSPVLDMEAIITQVCQAFGISREQLICPSRKQEYVCARNTAYYLARKHTDLSLQAIGKQFNRKHSTVLKGITSFEKEIGLKTSLGRQFVNTVALIERNGNILLQRDC